MVKVFSRKEYQYTVGSITDETLANNKHRYIVEDNSGNRRTVHSLQEAVKLIESPHMEAFGTLPPKGVRRMESL